jgi:acetyltransferase
MPESQNNIFEETLKNGAPYRIRPIAPDDVNRMDRLFRSLSPQTTYFRFMVPLKRLPRPILESFCNVDGHKECALAAEVRTGRRRELIGVVRWLRETSDPAVAQLMLVVADGWTNLGAGRTLYRRLIPIAKERGIRTMRGLILESNFKMISMLVNSEFTINTGIQDDLIVFSFDI